METEKSQFNSLDNIIKAQQILNNKNMKHESESYALYLDNLAIMTFLNELKKNNMPKHILDKYIMSDKYKPNIKNLKTNNTSLGPLYYNNSLFTTDEEFADNTIEVYRVLKNPITVLTFTRIIEVKNPFNDGTILVTYYNDKDILYNSNLTINRISNNRYDIWFTYSDAQIKVEYMSICGDGSKHRKLKEIIYTLKNNIISELSIKSDSEFYNDTMDIFQDMQIIINKYIKKHIFLLIPNNDISKILKDKPEESIDG